MRHIVLVEDDDVDREQIVRYLGGQHRLSAASSVAELERLLATEAPDLVLLDLFLPDRDGLETLKWLVERDIPTIMLTGAGSESVAVQAMKLGASDYLPKNRLTRSDLARVVSTALEVAAIKRRLGESQRQLALSEERLRLLIEHTPAAVAMLDRSLRYLAWSARWAADFRLAGCELAAAPLTAALTGLPPRWIAGFEGCLGGAALKMTEDEITGLDGQPECVRMEARPWLEAGRVGGVIVYCEFVTAQRQAERALHDAQRRLAQSERVNTMGALTAEVTHRIRQPLYAIRNFCQAQQRALRGEADRLSMGDLVVTANQQILAACDNAAGVVDELVEVARKVCADVARFDLRDAADWALAMLQNELEQAAVAVTYQRCPQPVLILGSSADLQYVVVCLLRNAVDSIVSTRQPGRIVLRLEQDADSAQLSLEDNGAGLQGATPESIFSPSQTTRLANLGLGLPVARTLVERHRGQIGCAQGNQGGATFWVRLPLAKAFDPKPEAQV